MYCNLGSDSIVHISEEVEDASLVVPRAMWYSYIGNVLLGLIMLITMLFCIGPLENVVSSLCALQMFVDADAMQLESDIPYLILFNNTGSPGLSIFLNVVLFLLIYAGNITALATCAREVFAFARDKGLPFSKVMAHMDPKWNIPFNAVYITSIGVVLLSLINLGSTLAVRKRPYDPFIQQADTSYQFNIIVSLSLLGLLSTYLISIGCVLLKRIKGESLPPARWSLGRYGLAVNAFAFIYCAFIIVFSCFPTSLPEDLGSANWAPLVWVGVIVISVMFYVLYGKRHYTAPVEFVDGKRPEGAALQSS